MAFFTKKTPLAMTLAALAVISPSCLPHHSCQDPCLVREWNAQGDIDEIYDTICVPDHPVTLEEAVSFALDNNLDVRMQEFEAMVMCETYASDKLKEIGQINVEGILKHRNRNTGSFSQSLTAQPPAPPSISSEEDTKIFDINYVWNILDYGLAYIQARQDLDRYEMIRQRHLRARQNLVLDVFRAFYRAAVAKRAVGRAESLIKDLKNRMKLIEEEVTNRTVAEMRGLTQEDRIVDIEIKLYAFRNEYRSAMTELQALMGVPPSCKMEIADIILDEPVNLDIDVCALEYDALTHRPELFSQDFQVRVDIEEIRASILRMYPSIAMFGGFHHDGNKFLIFHNWWELGLNATADLLSTPWKTHTIHKNWYQRWQDEATRLSMSMGVLTQVNLAFINVEETIEQYRLAQEFADVKRRKYDLALKIEEAGQFHADEVMDFEAESLFAELAAYKAYGNLQVALEQLGNATGRSLRFSQPDLGDQLCSVRQACDASLWMDLDTGMELEPAHYVPRSQRNGCPQEAVQVEDRQQEKATEEQATEQSTENSNESEASSPPAEPQEPVSAHPVSSRVGASGVSGGEKNP